MRAVVQRVTSASVLVEGAVTASIDQGLLVLIGLETADNAEDAEWLVTKLMKLRLFADETAPMNRSLLDVKGGLLIVSQFTLHGSVERGNRPSFHRSAPATVAKPLYEQVLTLATQALGRTVEAGIFGADMKVSSVNDGPVTLILDSKRRE